VTFVPHSEYVRRGKAGLDTRRAQQRQSIEIARELAEVVSLKRGMSHAQANELFERFKRNVSLIGDYSSGCWMKVGV
jgi:VIT1/CCC1 family predicted Fe2+/Mn2+ transporter